MVGILTLLQQVKYHDYHGRDLDTPTIGYLEEHNHKNLISSNNYNQVNCNIIRSCPAKIREVYVASLENTESWIKSGKLNYFTFNS